MSIHKKVREIRKQPRIYEVQTHCSGISHFPRNPRAELETAQTLVVSMTEVTAITALRWQPFGNYMHFGCSYCSSLISCLSYSDSDGLGHTFLGTFSFLQPLCGLWVSHWESDTDLGVISCGQQAAWGANMTESMVCCPVVQA
jgi:hypothetical protein